MSPKGRKHRSVQAAMRRDMKRALQRQIDRKARLIEGETVEAIRVIEQEVTDKEGRPVLDPYGHRQFVQVVAAVVRESEERRQQTRAYRSFLTGGANERGKTNPQMQLVGCRDASGLVDDDRVRGRLTRDEYDAGLTWDQAVDAGKVAA